ncbi:unnamed protein product, partial [Cyprideis torosa]
VSFPGDSWEIAEEPKCDKPHSDFVRFRNSCYWYSKVPMTLGDAEKTCSSRGGSHLASIHDTMELNYALSRSPVYEDESINSTDTWLGLRIDQDSQRYSWADGWPVLFSNWEYGQPKKPHGSHPCVAMTTGGPENGAIGRWRTLDEDQCRKQRALVLCKFNPSAPPLLPIPDSNKFCPPGGHWQDLGGDYCYMVSDNVTTWGGASRRCRMHGAFLTSIESENENRILHLVVKQYGKAMWIGLFRDINGNFIWEDGYESDFRNWRDHEPNDRDQSERCAEMYSDDGTWNDARCEHSYTGYICKIPKGKLNKARSVWSIGN